MLGHMLNGPPMEQNKIEYFGTFIDIFLPLSLLADKSSPSLRKRRLILLRREWILASSLGLSTRGRCRLRLLCLQSLLLRRGLTLRAQILKQVQKAFVLDV